MGFIESSTTVTLVAKLTPLGRERFATNAERTLITSFALGDSDANYFVTDSLTSGQVPSQSGDIGPNSSVSNSTPPIAGLKSVLIVNSNGVTTKPIESMNSTVVTNQVYNGSTIISGANLTYNFIDRNDYNTNSLVNLFYSFGLPLSYSDDVKFTGVTYSNGGYSDTGLSGMAQTKIIVIAIDNSKYGDIIDGKQIKVHFETLTNTFDIYGTFLNLGQSTKVLNTQYRDSSSVATGFGNNVALLYCDDVQKPNNDATLSWATGFGLNKPFSINSKQLSNLQTDPNTARIADVPVGIAYLNQGFVVLTHPSITSGYTASATTATTVTLNSLSTDVYQTITCIANRGEFAASSNPTFNNGDIPRITEVGLFNNRGELMAIAKTDRQVLKPVDTFTSFGVKIKF